MEMAIPPSDMMLALMPNSRMGMNARSTAAGIVKMGMIALGMCQRKSRMTSDTISISISSSCFSVSIDAAISSERS